MRLSNVVEKFKTKQTAEILALRKRVQTVVPAPPSAVATAELVQPQGREEQKKQRQLDLERLLQVGLAIRSPSAPPAQSRCALRARRG